MKIIGAILFLLCLFALSDKVLEYYACPPPSLCVPLVLCPERNITFDILEPQTEKPVLKYVCGVLSQTEGYVCCNDPVSVPENFVPNTTNWYFTSQTSSVASDQKETVPVFPYPGLENIKSNENEPKKTLSPVCPPASVCIKASACLPADITFYPGLSKGNYTCGIYSEAGFLCCLASGVLSSKSKRDINILNKLSKREENREKYENNINFETLGLLNKIKDIYANKEKLYSEATGRSVNKDKWECGRTLTVAQELHRIYSPIADSFAKEGDYPWHSAVLSDTYEYLCSGVIIGEKVVVTIAHCFDKNQLAEKLLVRVGDLDLKFETEANPAFDVKVKKLFIHPEYNRIKLNRDLAVIELDQSIRGIGHVRPACLPLPQFRPSITKCKVPGWGQFSQSKQPKKDEFSYKLRDSSFFIVDKRQCRDELRKAKELGPFFKLQEKVICAKGFSNSDTCKGDGGSGLVCRDQDVFVLKGLVSYGIGCGHNLPGVYTDVGANLDFIQNYKSYIIYRTERSEADDDREAKIVHTIKESDYKEPVNVPDYQINEEFIYDKIPDESIPIYFPDSIYEETVVDYVPDHPVYEEPIVHYDTDFQNYEPIKNYVPVYTVYKDTVVDNINNYPIYEEPVVNYASHPIYGEPVVEHVADYPSYEELSGDYVRSHSIYEHVDYVPNLSVYEEPPVYYDTDHSIYESDNYAPDYSIYEEPDYHPSVYDRRIDNTPDYVAYDDFGVNNYQSYDSEHLNDGYENRNHKNFEHHKDYFPDIPKRNGYGQFHEDFYLTRYLKNHDSSYLPTEDYISKNKLNNDKLYYEKTKGMKNSVTPKRKYSLAEPIKHLPNTVRKEKVPKLFSDTMASLTYDFNDETNH